MRRQFWLVLSASVLAGHVHGDSYPYSARIAADAPVYAGPGDDYYGTGRLSPGDHVDVYRRVRGGWLAVRPPKNSYSWVAADTLETTDRRDIARVVGGKAVAWIGTNDADVRDHKWQVRLKVGETVRVLGRERLSLHDGESEREYCKIEPPAGEFRWIHESAIRSEDETEAVEHVKLAEFRVVDQPDEPRDEFVARRSLNEDGPRVASLEPRKLSSSTIIDGSFASTLRDLNLQLSMEVAQPKERWRLKRLRRDIAALLEGSSTPSEKSATEKLANELEQFAALQGDRASSGGDGLGSTDAEPRSGVNSSGTEARPADGSRRYDPRFDGRGWLLPVHSSKQASPPYALLDGDGRVLQFVSPGPGLNLHRYLRKRVGIIGQASPRGFLDKPHLTAQRVVDLARHRR